ncbi:MAG: integrase core domain-containing protein [Pseudomonadota bacterium]
MQIHRSSYRYGSQNPVDEKYERVVSLSRKYPYWGYLKIYDIRRGEDIAIGRERVGLIRRREGLQVPVKRCKRRILGTTMQWVKQARYPNHGWSYAFVFDNKRDGRTIKCLTVVDEFSRRGLPIAIARSFTVRDVIRHLEGLFRCCGKPLCLRSVNGTEMIAQCVRDWLAEQYAETHYIAPVSPWEKAYNESFNSIYLTTCLDRWLFETMQETKDVTNAWLKEYNEVQPHGSLGGASPMQFLAQRNQ